METTNAGEISVDLDHQHPVRDTSNSNHGDPEQEDKLEFNEEEIRGILEDIASTGKFWHDWSLLKQMLSFQLKQVLSEYPEAKMTSEKQNASLGESFPDVLKRLDKSLLCFIEGPPFTLQRLCEILMAARSIYPNLLKLTLAVEKNLSVSSTLTMSPCPQTTTRSPGKSEKTSEELQLHSHSVQNGIEPVVEDSDEVMTEVEQADVDDEMTVDNEALHEIVGPSETNRPPTENA